jgi:hypothetical protein
MKAATTYRIVIMPLVLLLISIGFLAPTATAQSDKYPKMAPVEEYLMEKNAEILMGLSVWWREALTTRAT